MAPPSENEVLNQDQIDKKVEDVNELREKLAQMRLDRESGYAQTALQQQAEALDDEAERLKVEIAAEEALAASAVSPTSEVKTAKQLMLEQAAELEAANQAAQDAADAAAKEADPFGAEQSAPTPTPTPEKKVASKTAASSTTTSGESAPTGEGK